MMRQNLSAILILVCSLSYAQVGINNEQPNTTLDITSKKGINDKDGILIPRITKSELNAKAANTYTATQNSAMVYVTDIAAGTNTTSSAQTTKIVEPGFYYFKDTEWLPIGSSSPWLVQNSTASATKDSENIYRNNKVSIGDNLSTTTRDEELYVHGNSRFQTKNDGLVGLNNKQTILDLSRDELSMRNINRSPANEINSESYIAIDNNGNSPATPNYGTPKTIISAGSTIAGANRYAEYLIDPSDNKFNDGMGAHTFTTWLPDRTNSIVAIDEKGIKLGYINNLNGTFVSSLGSAVNPSEPNWTRKISAYYLPKVSPTAGQVLMFDQVVNPGNGIEPYTTTKWGNLSPGTIASFYNQNGTITNQRIVDVTDSNMVTYKRIGTINATDVPLLSANGSMQTMALRLDSDERLKENIKSIDGELALKLKPITYTWNAKGKEKGGNNKLQYGFIAQEVEKIMPDAVFTDKEGYKSVNYLEFIPVLTQKIKDQDETIKKLLERVEKLEAIAK
ncbi:tail fiber domain-containing protein [Chryseobacterium sp.]|uniref:tail fiber domain-containing protein n=1 Tax=Chryseobacterium sp. TaxID=1871047 RepID=UPI00388E62CE